MKSKPKTRIYSQNHHSSVQDADHIKGQLNRFKRKPSNFGNEFVYDRQSTAKIYQPSKILGNFDVRPQEILLRKVSHQDNLQMSKARALPKKISQHKLKSLGVNFAKNDPGKYLIDDLILEGNNQLTEVKFSFKQNKRKQKDKKKLIFFTKGNNHNILKEIFLNRFNFIQTPLRQNAHVCWLQSINQKQFGFRSSKSLYDDHLPDISGKNKVQLHNTIYNYLQSQSELTNKQKMYKNMKKYSPQSIGSYIPVSFIIDFKQQPSLVEESLMEFIRYYIKKQSKKPKSRAMYIKNYFMQINITNKQISKLQDKNHSILDNSSHSFDEVDDKPDSSDSQDKIWILKPTSLNRGRGIHLFSSLKQLARLLSESSFQISVKMYNDNISAKSYIIQQYIQRPLLIEGYKFDMRVWVFVNILKVNGKRVLKTYLFKHGYSRLASIKYVAEEKQKQGSEITGEQKQQTPISPKKDKKSYITNKFIHLTNNAVQKDAKGYGNYCQGNQLSIEQTVQYFKNNRQNCPIQFQSILQQMKKIVGQSVNSVKQKLLSRNSTKTFQLLGYDFLIDQKYNLWLIEINNNPCLQQSSQLLSKLLRDMLSGLVVLSELQEPKSTIGSEGWIEII